MTHRHWAPIGAVAAILAVTGGLGACATKGKPAPLGANGQRRQEPGPNQPTKTIDPRDQNASPAPPRTVPIQGQSPNPFGAAPPGALPDPYSNPPR